MKSLPVGIKDFKELRSNEYYYVDKSMLIGQMLDHNGRGVHMFLRPRRFGKSLNLSMIDAFFNIRYMGNKWFDGLEISNHPEYDKYRNAFPVISLNLGIGDVPDFEKYLETINLRITAVFKEFAYLLDSPRLSDAKKEKFAHYLSGDLNTSECQFAPTLLCDMLESYHGRKVIILVDEYDSAVINVSDPELRCRIQSFVNATLDWALKGNSSLQMGVLTGTMHIVGHYLSAPLDNVMFYDVLNSRFGDMFGLTYEEVERICIDYGHPEKFTETKEWYGGYHIGNTDLCSPWSILNYVQNGFVPKTYWSDTSTGALLEDLLSRVNENISNHLIDLGSKNSIRLKVKTTTTVEEISEFPYNVFPLMVMLGYLGSVLDRYETCSITIPNKEILSVFAELVFAKCPKQV